MQLDQIQPFKQQKKNEHPDSVTAMLSCCLISVPSTLLIFSEHSLVPWNSHLKDQKSTVHETRAGAARSPGGCHHSHRSRTAPGTLCWGRAASAQPEQDEAGFPAPVTYCFVRFKGVGRGQLCHQGYGHNLCEYVSELMYEGSLLTPAGSQTA